MLDVRTLNPAVLARYSELSGSKGSGSGARKMRDFVQYDRQSYAQAGVTGLTFFNSSGNQKDLSGALTVRASNQVQAGIMDEPLFVTAIAVDFITALATPATDAIDIMKVMQSGRLAISINDIEVLEVAPLGSCGSRLGVSVGGTGTNATPIANAWNGNRPMKLASPLLIDEQLRFKVTCDWTAVVAVAVAGALMVSLIGVKYFKN